MHLLGGVQHLPGPLGSGDGGQLVDVVAGVEGCARPAGFPSLAARRQHVAHLAVEVRVGGQPVEDQVLDPPDGVSERERERERKRLETWYCDQCWHQNQFLKMFKLQSCMALCR